MNGDEAVMSATLTEIQKFEEDFFGDRWEALTGVRVTGIENLATPQEKADRLYEALIPSLDLYIDTHEIPSVLLSQESATDFAVRATSRLYDLNRQKNGGWNDTWPVTALPRGRADCALGSLILARALNRAGIPLNEIELDSPGPLSHAAVIVNGVYADQANGVVVPVSEAGHVGDKKCYWLDAEHPIFGVTDNVPFRLVPVHDVATGVRPLVTNLDGLIGAANKGDAKAQYLVGKFGVGNEKIYEYGFTHLMPVGWKPKEMLADPIWKNENEESGKRINESIERDKQAGKQ